MISAVNTTHLTTGNAMDAQRNKVRGGGEDVDRETIESKVERLRNRYYQRLDDRHYDLGTPASGNWGHQGLKGQMGGSSKGGGIQNRLYRERGNPKAGFTSNTKHRKEVEEKRREVAKPHKLEREELDYLKKGTIITGMEGYPGTWENKGYHWENKETGEQKYDVQWFRDQTGSIIIPEQEGNDLKPNVQILDKTERERWKNPQGPKGWKRATTVEEMVGKEAIREYDTGDHPNKYPPDDPKWGTEPGVYTVYRTGEMNRNIIFTGNKFEGVDSYTTRYPEEEQVGGAKQSLVRRSAVYTYTVEVKRPYVARNLHDTYMRLFGKKPSKSANGWIAADNKIRKELEKRGYDAWCMTEPAPPAEKELNLFGASIATMQETGRKIPDDVKNAWEAAVELGTFESYEYSNGKYRPRDYDEFMESDAYKVGKAQNKW